MINPEIEMLDGQVKGIVKYLKPEMIGVEIGSYAGKLTLEIAKICRVTAVDPFINQYDAVDYTFNSNMREIRNIFLDRIKDKINIIHIEATSEYTLSQWKGEIDFLVIDGDHTKEGIEIDKGWLQYLKKGGIVFIHDYSPVFPGIKNFVDNELKNKYKELEIIDSLIIFRK